MKPISFFVKLLLSIVLIVMAPFGAIALAQPTPARRNPRSGTGLTGNRIRASRRPDDDAGISLANRRAWYSESGTPMTQTQNSKLTSLYYALSAIWFDNVAVANADQPANDILQVFNIQESTQAIERNLGYSGGSGVPELTPGGALEYDKWDELYVATYQHKTYAKGLAFERELVEDDQYGVINRRATMFSMQFDREAYRLAASVFNNAFSSSYLGSDSKALCATDHPNGGNAFGNKGTSALTQSAVEDTVELMMAFEDSNGEPLPITPDTLIVPVGLRKEALTIAGTELRTGTANNDTNTVAGYNVIVSRWLTDANNWFLVDSGMAKMFLNWYWRIRPEFVEDPQSDFNMVTRYRGRFRASYGWDHWGWLYGHEVS